MEPTSELASGGDRFAAILGPKRGPGLNRCCRCGASAAQDVPNRESLCPRCQEDDESHNEFVDAAEQRLLDAFPGFLFDGSNLEQELIMHQQTCLQANAVKKELSECRSELLAAGACEDDPRVLRLDLLLERADDAMKFDFGE
jgi:hypothetical protein